MRNVFILIITALLVSFASCKKDEIGRGDTVTVTAKTITITGDTISGTFTVNDGYYESWNDTNHNFVMYDTVSGLQLSFDIYNSNGASGSYVYSVTSPYSNGDLTNAYIYQTIAPYVSLSTITAANMTITRSGTSFTIKGSVTFSDYGVTTTVTIDFTGTLEIYPGGHPYKKGS